jgi:hypothetical protein
MNDNDIGPLHRNASETVGAYECTSGMRCMAVFATFPVHTTLYYDFQSINFKD